MSGPRATRLRFRDLTLGYDGRPALRHLDGAVEAGETLAIVGPNGAGKSTLLKAIAGLLQPLSGAIEGGAHARDVAYLPQTAAIDRSFPIDVYDFVSTGLWPRAGVFGGVGRNARARVLAAIEATGLAGFERRQIGALSGGQTQRMLFARLALQDASLVLLDEPFAAIDGQARRDLLALVENWRARGRTVLAVLHDLELVRAHFPRALLLAGEAIAWGPTSAVLTEANLGAARGALDALDRDDRGGRRAA